MPSPRELAVPRSKRSSTAARGARTDAELAAAVQDTLAALRRSATRRDRDGLARYAIPSEKALGVSMTKLKVHAKRLGRDHALALGLWETDVYEARMLATLIDEPERVTPAQMERWARAFDSWAICDTACFALFDRTPHAWGKVARWSERREEFVKRGAFALLASLALHRKDEVDAPFLESLARIERAASDERNFVKKGVNWALRAIGRRNPALHAAALAVARRLAASDDATERWVGKDAVRELTGPVVLRRLAASRKRSTN
ncbi:MAG: DNA alkylation repair protein [Planctomycetes bacterium]|nr:DNA alkylation repair protein [Planctomycetota bacterium]